MKEELEIDGDEGRGEVEDGDEAGETTDGWTVCSHYIAVIIAAKHSLPGHTSAAI